jgi:hypothetical protein
MKKIKKIIGCLLIATPVIVLGVTCAIAGRFNVFCLALVTAAVILIIVSLGVKLIQD